MFASSLVIDRPGNNPEINRRYESRHEIHQRALVQVTDTADQYLVGMAFHAEVINVSTHGMRLSAKQFGGLMDGGTFELWISVDGYPAKLYLKCEGQWVSWEEDKDFHMGVQTLDKLDTDVEEWRRITAKSHAGVRRAHCFFGDESRPSSI